MIVLEIDIPKLTKEGIDIKKSFRSVSQLYCSSMSGF